MRERLCQKGTPEYHVASGRMRNRPSGRVFGDRSGTDRFLDVAAAVAKAMVLMQQCEA